MVSIYQVVFKEPIKVVHLLKRSNKEREIGSEYSWTE